MTDLRPRGVAYEWCAEGSTLRLGGAIERLYRELPGWWFSLGNCSVSADATVGPDRTGADSWLLQFEVFDQGIDGSLLHPATLADALHNAIDKANAAKSQHGLMHGAAAFASGETVRS